MELFEETNLGFLPVVNTMAVIANKFQHAGELCALSIVEGGPAPNFISSWMYAALVKGIMHSTFDEETVLMKENFNKARVMVWS